MGVHMNNLRNLGSQFKVSLPIDESGYLGRECPVEECKGYFKIVPGTGLNGITDVYCPYCGRKADQSNYHTQDQIEFARSIVLGQVLDALDKDLKSLEFDIKPKGMFGIGLSMKVSPGKPHPIHWYKEKGLETHIQCSSCTLKYAVYGVFAFCPDCGQHNSLQILDKNLEVISKMLEMADNAEGDMAERLIENALEDCVSAFDGFGRELCRVFAKKSSDPIKAEKISFQQLDGARQNANMLFKIDIDAGLAVDEWNTAVRAFQKRHLLSHKMGVVDAEYIRKSADMRAVVGRKIKVTSGEVRMLGQIMGKLGRNLSIALGGLGS